MSDDSSWKLEQRTRNAIENRQRYWKNALDTRSNMVAVIVFDRNSTAC